MNLNVLSRRWQKEASCPKQCDDKKYNEGQSKTESHYCHESLDKVKLNNSDDKNNNKKRFSI